MYELPTKTRCHTFPRLPGSWSEQRGQRSRCCPHPSVINNRSRPWAGKDAAMPPLTICRCPPSMVCFDSRHRPGRRQLSVPLTSKGSQNPCRSPLEQLSAGGRKTPPVVSYDPARHLPSGRTLRRAIGPAERASATTWCSTTANPLRDLVQDRPPPQHPVEGLACATAASAPSPSASFSPRPCWWPFFCSCAQGSRVDNAATWP